MCVLCWRVCVMLACVCYAGVYVVMLACVCCDYVCDLCVCVLCWLVCSYAGVYVLNKLLSTACTLFDVREAMGGNKLYRVHLFLMQGRQRGRQRKQVPFGGTVQRTPKRTVSIPAENGIHPRREPQGTPQRTPRYPAENPKFIRRVKQAHFLLRTHLHTTRKAGALFCLIMMLPFICSCRNKK